MQLSLGYICLPVYYHHLLRSPEMSLPTFKHIFNTVSFLINICIALNVSRLISGAFMVHDSPDRLHRSIITDLAGEVMVNSQAQSLLLERNKGR